MADDGVTRQQLVDQLAEVNAAIARVLKGKATTIGGITYQREGLDQLRTWRTELRTEIREMDAETEHGSSGPRVRQLVLV